MLNLIGIRAASNTCIGTALLVLILSGCSPQQSLKHDLADYHERLARVLEDELVSIEFEADISFPDKQTLFRENEPLNINVRDFYALPDCRLNTLIAERNTALGKIQLPSQRFIYETQLLGALSECAEVSQDDRLTNKLLEVLAIKQQQYTDSYANLIQTSNEVFYALTQSSGFVVGTAADGFQETRLALQYLANFTEPLSQLAMPPKHFQSEYLEASLKDLNQFRLLIRMWRSQQLITQWFTQSTPWLVKNTRKLNCYNRADKDTVNILRNVFMLFFAEKIQPIAGQLNYYHYQLKPTLQQFIDSPYLDPLWQQAILRQFGTQHDAYKQSIQAHIQVWQELFKRCGVSPGRT